jgi:hypothetical protein
MPHTPEFKRIYEKLEFDDPCPEAHMIGRSNGKFICHIMRRIYAKTDDPEIKLMARIGTTMGRKMIWKLMELNAGWSDLYAMTKKD